MHNNRWMTDNKRGGPDRGPYRGGPSRAPFRGGPGRSWSRGGWAGNHRGFHNFDGGFRRQNNFGGNFNQWKPHPRRETPGKRLSENQIGVTEYVGDHEGFNGIIKSRYSDFQVSEINEKGEVAKLTDINPPEPPAEETVDEDEELLTKYNLEILPIDTWDKINALVVESEPKEEKVEIDVTGVTKEQRTKIHEAVKRAFADSVVGSTVTVDDKKFVRFVKYRKGVRIDKRVKWMWPADYVYFIVHKENIDTMDVAVRIAERLGPHMKPSMLGYAGTKDRRAKTSQWFSVRRVDPRRLASATRALRDVRIGNYSFQPVGLKLGMLKGNMFRIALRNVTAPDDKVDYACQQLKEKGFINYYGLQRFGSRADTPTYHIGRKLLQGNYKEAIDAILEVREGPLEYALGVYKEYGAAAAYKVIPKRAGNSSHSETKLLKGLADNPNDLVGALNRLARNTRLLYIHAYQSWLWNRAASERVRRHGLRAARGDLVPLQTLPATDEIDDAVESDDEENPNETDAAEDDDETQSGGEQDGGTQDGAEMKRDNEQTKGTDNTEIKKKKEPDAPKQMIPVKVLTQEDADSGRYTIFDIVLPLPGYLVQYPPNMKEYYEEMLKSDGLTTNLKRKIKSYSLCGAYRRVCLRPAHVAWRAARYSEPFADLLPSDLDLLEARAATGVVHDGKYKALLLEMSLPSSCYATMALRELLRADTSSNHQAMQNDYHKASKRTQETDQASDGDAKKVKQEEVKQEKVQQDNKRTQETDLASDGDATKVKQENLQQANNRAQESDQASNGNAKEVIPANTRTQESDQASGGDAKETNKITQESDLTSNRDDKEVKQANKRMQESDLASDGDAKKVKQEE